jgi:cytochrome c
LFAQILLAVSVIVCANSPVHAQATGDPINGEKVTKKCMACHSFDSDKTKVGPTLQGVYGRAAGSVPGFSYSSAMLAKAPEIGTWDDQKLDTYLSSPSDYVGGQSKMTFKLSKEQDRLDIIAYLKAQSKP